MFFLIFLTLFHFILQRSRRLCRHWMTIRFFLLLLSIGRTAIDIVMKQYTILTGILDLEKIYRLYTLYLVRDFIQEMQRGMVHSLRERRQIQPFSVY